ncbi:MAG: cupin domain-containing protein [Chitinophagaceae bacterium]|nr:MAG: cupin domain-containing protein [Chitinophagaceae bacterium]
MMPYQIQVNPFVVPTNDGKLIEEHVGLASTGDKQISIAHMIAPPGWSEPFQTPDFDEYTLVSRGKKMFEVDGEEIILEAGQSILITGGTRVRYSNPFDEECEYWSVCLPAFSIEAVHREEQ